MGPRGALSNPEVEQRFAHLDTLRRQLLAEAGRTATPKRTIRWRCGTVAATVVEVLRDADGPLRARDIRLAVEQRLGGPVSKGTVESCLSVGWRGKSRLFVRVSHGKYQLRGAAPSPADAASRRTDESFPPVG
jgi:hypothetical protein